MDMIHLSDGLGSAKLFTAHVDENHKTHWNKKFPILVKNKTS